MRTYWHIILITSCLIAGLGAGVSPSQADGYNGHRQYGGHGDRHRSGHGYRSAYRHGYGPGYGYRPGYRRGYSYSLGYGYSPGYGYDYGYGWGIGYGYSGGHHGRHGSSFDLFFSAPLYLGPSYYPQPATVIVPHTIGAPPQPAGIAPATPTCQQTREYQTEITVGDEVVPAYGMACLQADGSWKIISGPTVAE
jgi:hypothetical protein